MHYNRHRKPPPRYWPRRWHETRRWDHCTSSSPLTVTADRDGLRAELDNGRKLDDLRLRMLQNAEKALTAEHRLYDEQLRRCVSERGDGTKAWHSGGGKHRCGPCVSYQVRCPYIYSPLRISCHAVSSEDELDPVPNKRRRVSGSSLRGQTTPGTSQRTMDDVIRKMQFKKRLRRSSPA
ncbi:hypothetical protein C8R43DRAFT_163365 [Mycena crocata]|nr:hypothetical protein C8R43DRAFT_163365 [Mycena crocata]